jgi:hypothetical protein
MIESHASMSELVFTMSEAAKPSFKGVCAICIGRKPNNTRSF